MEMRISKLNSKAQLSVIIPFKSTNSIQLRETIAPLLNQCNLRLSVLIASDQSCVNIATEEVNRCILGSDCSSKHSVHVFPAKKKGIYPSINQALQMIEYESLYIVLGAGDVLTITSPIDLVASKGILLIPYAHSVNLDVIVKPRHLYSGMPYCHNAIIFAKNHLEYDTNYSISADYKYFIQYLSQKNIRLDELDFLPADRIRTTYDTSCGISKRLYLKKNLQNLEILLEVGLVPLLMYTYQLVLKLSKRI